MNEGLPSSLSQPELQERAIRNLLERLNLARVLLASLKLDEIVNAVEDAIAFVTQHSADFEILPAGERRAWKPIDLGGFRLYSVTGYYGGAGDRGTLGPYIVAARAPMAAAELVRKCFEGCEGDAFFRGKALNVLQPASWWDEGIPEPGDPRFSQG